MMNQQSSNSAFALSKEQLQQFESLGFAVIRQLFTADEMLEISKGFMHALGEAARTCGIEDGTRPLIAEISPLLETHEVFCRLFDDPRIQGIAEELAGTDCLYYGGFHGNCFPAGHTSWHPEQDNPHYRMLLVAMYLDELDADNGCLRVIPGSHHPDFHVALRRAFDSKLYDLHSPDVPGSYALPSKPGDLVAFDQALYHGSWGGGPGRRMFRINFAANPKPGWQTWYVKTHADFQRPSRRKRRLFSDEFAKTGNPQRLRRINKLLEWGYCDETKAPLSKDSVMSMMSSVSQADSQVVES